MISRFKWYSVRLPCSIAEALQKLDEHRYVPEKKSGFIVDALARSFQFYWKTSIYATTMNADGESQREEVTSLCSQQVDILGDERLVFRMQEPPRSLREMLNALDKVLGFGFACEQINVSDKLVKKSIEDFGAATLNSIKMSGAVGGIAAIARIEIASKIGIDQDLISGFGLTSSVIEAGTYSVRYKGLSGQVGFTRSGLCKISGDLSLRIQSVIESNILKGVH
jgi:hypothetical protein